MRGFFNRFFALFIFISIFPLFFIIYLFLFVKIGNPVIFKQLRSGFYGKNFFLYKFRTMKVNLKINEKKRFYKSLLFLRKFRIDELPQLINVIKGDLFFIGPRPLLPEYNKFYKKKHLLRFKIMPGITGWAQVNGDNNLSWSKKFELDIWYASNKNFILDLKIIYMTFLFLVKKILSNKKEKIIIERFNGKN
jgi:lipopolysaccharide/colanic/teichoic acid biosynthesis glycosyltransferase